MPNILAIDAGASKTELMLLAADTQQILAQWQSGNGNLALLGVEKWLTKISHEIEVAETENAAEIKLVVAGIAGLNTGQDWRELNQAWQLQHPQIKLVAVNDILLGLLGNQTQANAIALISGTGANCLGWNETGQIAQVGSVDFFGDRGSGYEIGYNLIRRAIKARDFGEDEVILGQVLLEMWQVDKLETLVAGLVGDQGLQKSKVAQVGGRFLDWWDANPQQVDAAMVEVMTQAINDLTQNVQIVAQKLNLTNTPAELILIGGIVTKHPFIFDWLAENFKQQLPQLKLILPQQTPVSGAMKLAQLVINKQTQQLEKYWEFLQQK